MEGGAGKLNSTASRRKEWPGNGLRGLPTPWLIFFIRDGVPRTGVIMNRLHAVAALVALCLAGTSGAQEVPVQPAQPLVAAADSVVRTAEHSALDRPSEAVHRSDRPAAAPLPATGQHLGEAKAEMAVGGAAIVVGALIGGDGGSVLMFGGAIVGLYGLWNYLK